MVANRRQHWGFIVGMILYALDSLPFLLAGVYLDFGFHLFAFYCIFAGYRALKKLEQAEATVAAAGPAVPAPPETESDILPQ